MVSEPWGYKSFLKIVLLICLQFFTDKEPIFTIPIKNILAVEKLDENSFNKKNVSQKNLFIHNFWCIL